MSGTQEAQNMKAGVRPKIVKQSTHLHAFEQVPMPIESY